MDSSLGNYPYGVSCLFNSVETVVEGVLILVIVP